MNCISGFSRMFSGFISGLYERGGGVRKPWNQVLGTPTREEIKSMNPNYTEFKFPEIKAQSWQNVFPKRTTPDVLDLLSHFLQFSPRPPLLTCQ